jgi:hypothetical protein
MIGQKAAKDNRPFWSRFSGKTRTFDRDFPLCSTVVRSMVVLLQLKGRVC